MSRTTIEVPAPPDAAETGDGASAEYLPAPDEEREASAATPESVHHRRIRSFVTRAGRTSPAQQRARDTLGTRYVVPFEAGRRLDFTTLFGRVAPVVLEIGFGMGAATAVIAAARRDVDFVGVEVHTPGVGALLKMVGEAGLSNLRIVEHDAVDVVEQTIPSASLAGILVWFPDPWHKARHNKRRLIQPAFVATLAGRLAPGGFLHCATDWEDYAVQMLEVQSAEPMLRNTAGTGYATPHDPLLERPVTKFETRGKRLGHGVWDLVFARAAE